MGGGANNLHKDWKNTFLVWIRLGASSELEVAVSGHPSYRIDIIISLLWTIQLTVFLLKFLTVTWLPKEGFQSCLSPQSLASVLIQSRILTETSLLVTYKYLDSNINNIIFHS